MRMKKIDVLLFQALFVLVAGIVVSRVAGLNSISSMLFLATFPVTALLWLSSLSEGLDKTDWIMFSAVGLAVFSVVINLVANLMAGNPGVGGSYFKKGIMFTLSLMFLQTCNKMRAPGILRELLHRLNSSLVVFFTIAHLLLRDQMHMLNNIPTKYAPFNFSNPNLTAIFFTCIFMLEVIRLLCVREQWKQILHAVLSALMAYFIYDTRSRNGLLVMVLFMCTVVCVVLRKKIREKIHITVPRRVILPAAAGIALIPTAFAVLYMTFIGSQWVYKVFAFLEDKGKKLNSRVKEWKPAFDAIREQPLFGDYYGISDGTGAGHMHNTHIDMAASYGLPVMFLVCALLTIYIWQRGKRYKKQAELLYMIGFCCVLMLGIFESVMFSGGMASYVYMGAFLLLSCPVYRKGSMNTYHEAE